MANLINLIFYKTKECELKELETMKIQYLDKIKDVCNKKSVFTKKKIKEGKIKEILRKI